MESEGGKSRKKKKKLFFALSPSPLSRTLPLPPPRKLQLPARTVAGLPLFHAMQASLRLPSQGLTQVRRGRSGPSAGGGRSSICLREKSCLLPFDSLVLNLRPSLFVSEKKTVNQRTSSTRSSRKSTRAQAVSAPTSAPASATQVSFLCVLIERVFFRRFLTMLKMAVSSSLAISDAFETHVDG